MSQVTEGAMHDVGPITNKLLWKIRRIRLSVKCKICRSLAFITERLLFNF